MADAGQDLAGLVDQPVLLRGSGSDPNGDPLTYRWTQDAGNPTGVTLSSETTATPVFTPPEAGRYLFTLTVTDSQQATDADTAAVVVSAQAGGSNDHASNPGETGPRDTLVGQSAPDVGLTTSGAIAVGGEQDWFAFHAQRGTVYTIELVPDSLPSALLRLYAADGATVLSEVSGPGATTTRLPEFRPASDGVHYIRVTALDTTATGTYTIGALLRREALRSPPATSMGLARSGGGFQATLRTSGTTLPLSNLNVLVAFDGAKLQFTNPRPGPTAADFSSSFLATLPTLLAVNLDATPLRPVPASPSDVLASFDFSARAGILPGPESDAVPSVAATNNATSVQVFRPTADAGLPRSLLSDRLGGQPIHLDGRPASKRSPRNRAGRSGGRRETGGRRLGRGGRGTDLSVGPGTGSSGGPFRPAGSGDDLPCSRPRGRREAVRLPALRRRWLPQ